ncbi:hypothetical protein GCM10009792_20440 [Microcella alkalica]
MPQPELLSPDGDVPGIGLDHSREYFDERGLSRTIFSDKTMYFASLNLNIGTAQRDGVTILLG